MVHGDRVGADAVRERHLLGVGDQVAVGQEHALGAAGGPGGELHTGDGVRIGRGGGRARRPDRGALRGGVHGLVQGHGAVGDHAAGGVRDDDRAQCGQVGAELGQQAGGGRGHEREFHPCRGEDVPQSVLAGERVDEDGDGAAAGRAVVGGGEDGVEDVGHAHAGARGSVERAVQEAGDPVGPRVEFGEADGPGRGADGDPVRRAPRRSPQQSVDGEIGVCEVRQRSFSSWSGPAGESRRLSSPSAGALEEPSKSGRSAPQNVSASRGGPGPPTRGRRAGGGTAVNAVGVVTRPRRSRPRGAHAQEAGARPSLPGRPRPSGAGTGRGGRGQAWQAGRPPWWSLISRNRAGMSSGSPGAAPSASA